MMALIRSLFLPVLLLSTFSYAQSFKTRVSASTIGKNDVLQVEYIAENAAIEQFVLPHFKNWMIVSGPNVSSSRMQSGNVVRQQMVYSIMLQPVAAGTFIVPGASARINDKPVKSDPVKVRVTKTPHQPNATPTPPTPFFDPSPQPAELPETQYLKKGENAIDKIKDNLMVHLEVSKKSCYVGEPILATYKLCTRLRSKSKVVKQPSFTGCTVVELTGDNQDQHVEKINGINYNVFVIRKVQLIPLDAGELVLPATQVENKVSFFNASNISWKDMYYNTPLPVEEQTVTLQNKPATIQVKSLPPLPSVSDKVFSGAIGSFDISVAVGQQHIRTNETNHLLFTITGMGSLQNVKNPQIQWPAGVEAFEATEKNEQRKEAFPPECSKMFTIPFVAQTSGNYQIPPIQFTYFDANEERYITKATPAFALMVAPGNKATLPAAKHEGDTNNPNLPLVIAAITIITIATGLVLYNKRVKKAQKVANTTLANTNNTVTTKVAAEEYLFCIRELQPEQNNAAFYKQLSKNLQGYLQAKYNITPAEIPMYVQQHPATATYLQQLANLLHDCNQGMYTPVFTVDEALQHRLQSIDVINKLEKETA